MRSLIGSAAGVLKAQAPPYVSRGARQIPLATNGLGLISGGPETQMRAMGANGTLFAIVSRLITATSAATWKLWTLSASGKADDRTQVVRHKALDVWNKPNPFMTQREFVQTFQQHKELTGEAWWLVPRGASATLPPTEMWPVRPDRVEVVPDQEEFISRYDYLSPDGEKVPLQRGEMIFQRYPNPLDIYRGIGPVQAILCDLDSARYSTEWNRNFFLNSAEPGGVIEYEEELSEDDFNQAAARWREQHRGVGNAHRVAIIERGKWIGNAVTQRDMQFAELNHVTRDTIREAFAFPKPMLGAVDDVNRANAEAAEVVLARWHIKDRLDEIKHALNFDFLPMFGAAGAGLEFDYDNPVPDDRAADALELTAKAGALKIFMEQGAVWKSACEALKLPEMEWEKPEPPPVPLLPGVERPGSPEPGEAPPGKVGKPKPKTPAAASLQYAWSEPVYGEIAPDDIPDLTRVQVAWEKAVEATVKAWAPLRKTQVASLVEQIRDAIADKDPARLTRLSVTSDAGASVLTEAMETIALSAGKHVVAEAKAQGVTLQPAAPAPGVLADAAELSAAYLAASLSLAAGREAIRIRRTGERAMLNAVPMSVEDHMRAFLEGMGDSAVRTEIGAALTHAQNQGRFETLLSGPTAALYASEQNDKSTCKPCAEVDGRWLGNSDGVDMAMLNKTYPNSGYVGCLGRDRCRGTVTGVWRKGTE